VGDTLDFWRVEQLKEGHSLRLKAEMKLPGQAWLQFDVIPLGVGDAILTQTTRYAPKGLLGLLYWGVVLPAHRLISYGLLQALSKESEILQKQVGIREQ
jgi:hypothetical protein